MNSFLWLPAITGAESILRSVTYLAVSMRSGRESFGRLHP